MASLAVGGFLKLGDAIVTASYDFGGSQSCAVGEFLPRVGFPFLGFVFEQAGQLLVSVAVVTNTFIASKHASTLLHETSRQPSVL